MKKDGLPRKGEAGAVLTCREDSDKPILVSQDFWYADLPFEGESIQIVVHRPAENSPAHMYLLMEH